VPAIEIKEMTSDKTVTDRTPKNKDAPPDSPPENVADASKGGDDEMNDGDDGALSVKAKT
jgi:hypothetical protein